MDNTTIRVSTETHARLQHRGAKDDSFDTIISGMLDSEDQRIAASSTVHDPMHHRKMIVRSALLPKMDLDLDSVCYAPFNSAIAIEAFGNMKLYGIGSTLKDVKKADGPVVIADFDNMQDQIENVYEAFAAFWAKVSKADRMAIFFTDDARREILRTGTLVHPSGDTTNIGPLAERSKAYKEYFSAIVTPWFEEVIAPYVIVDRRKVIDGLSCLWGVIIEREDVEAAEDTDPEEDAE